MKTWDNCFPILDRLNCQRTKSAVVCTRQDIHIGQHHRAEAGLFKLDIVRTASRNRPAPSLVVVETAPVSCCVA